MADRKLNSPFYTHQLQSSSETEMARMEAFWHVTLPQCLKVMPLCRELKWHFKFSSMQYTDISLFYSLSEDSSQLMSENNSSEA